MIDLVPESGFADLIKTSKLVEADAETVRHNKSVKRNSEPTLTGAFNGMDIAEDATAGRNQNVAVIMRVHVVADQAIHGS